jgi:hypothetical protein
MRSLPNKERRELKNYASASIIEEEDGTYSISQKDTSAIYSTILALNKNSVTRINQELNIINQEPDFYSFNTSMFNTFTDNCNKNKLILTQNSKQGNAGNISKSFFSLVKNTKIINTSMFRILNKAEIKVLVLNDDNDKFIIDIESISDWNDFLENIDKYKPIRLFLKNVSFPECNNFYLKPINAYITSVFKSLTDEFIKDNNLKEVKSRYIRENFGYEVSEYISGISNQNFIIDVKDNVLRKIYLVEKTQLYFPYEGNQIHNYDEYSFIKSKYKFIKNDPIFEILDVLDLYSKKHNNTFDTKVFFLRKESSNIDSIIQKNIITSSDVLLNNNDDKYLTDLYKMEEGIVFSISKSRSGKNSTVRINDFKTSNIKVTLHDRSYNKYDNINNLISWFIAINEGLSFEREKTLSVFFIERLVKFLIDNGHTDIEIELEKPVNKKDGRRGFLDLFIKSVKDGNTYGQVYEFKAVYNYNDKSKEIFEEQALGYDIIHDIIDKHNITHSYDDCNHLEVELLNLI